MSTPELLGSTRLVVTILQRLSVLCCTTTDKEGWSTVDVATLTPRAANVCLIDQHSNLYEWTMIT